jgi:predicted  nucleic acid-binding Zn-ribbon protein
LDRLVDYSTEVISDPLQVINPDYRQLDGQVRSCTGKLNRRLAQFGAMNLDAAIEPKQVAAFMQRKADLQEEINALQHEIQTLKDQRKATARHINVDELPEEAQFRRLSTQSKQLIDTIKMIAYRAETGQWPISCATHCRIPTRHVAFCRAFTQPKPTSCPIPTKAR